jgi:glycosyltransferase involved in cell wall biosynthesis
MTDIHEMPFFHGRIAIQQRVFPAYRAPFFERLAASSQRGLSLFAGQALPQEEIAAGASLNTARFFPARNLNFFPIKSSLYHCWQAEIVKWLEEWQPDVLIVEASPRCTSTRLAVRWMHRRSRPVVGWGLGAPPYLQSNWPASLLNRLRKWERGSLLASLNGIIAYSRKGAEEYLAAGFPDRKVFVAHNAVTPRPAGPPPVRPESFDPCPTVLFVGRLQARKRIDLLIEACAALSEPLQPRLWIAGSGPALPSLEEIARRKYPKTRFFGHQKGSALEELFNQADLFVLPGTGGLAVQQAMAHALPVLAAEGDGTLDDLIRPQNGLRLPPGDLRALIQALQACLSDPSRLRKMGRESFRIVQEEINLEEMTASFITALSQITQFD